MTLSTISDRMKTAVIHEWLVSFAGSERVLNQILQLFPDADLYCLMDFMLNGDREFIADKNIRTSFIQKLPFAEKDYRSYLPLMPLAVAGFDLSEYELIISSSHAVAKGVRKRPHQLHICYCHTPMRYAWDLKEQYLQESGMDRGVKGALARMVLNWLQKWDFTTAQDVDYFVANSHYVADRIKRAYGRYSTVIYPPVDVDTFTLCEKKEDFYLTASRMVSYKKTDLIVEAFSGVPDQRLVVIGDGPSLDKIKAKAGNNIELLGHQASDVLKTYMQRAKAFVFAAEEDFGIVTVEAQACGTPVIAFGRGGSLETIVGLQNTDAEGQRTDKKPTGLFFYEQTTEALQNAILAFEKNQEKFDGQQIRENAIRFSVERFKREFKDFVDRKIADNK